MDVLNDRFHVQSQIGKGRWSVVHKALDANSNIEVAVKLEEGVPPEHSLLLREAKILKYLGGLDGIPRLIDNGSTATHNFMVLELLDANLDELYRRKKLSTMDVMFKAEQLLIALEAVHSRHIVHQDLKPKNIMAKGSKTYLIDFGLATKVKKSHKDLPRTKGMLGTPSFASLTALLGSTQFPKDDLESLGYVIVWLLKGCLPWESYVTEGNLSGLKTMKFHSTVRQICQDCPEEMMQYFNHIRGLKATDKPDYEFLKELMVAAHRKFTVNKLAASPFLEKRIMPRRRMCSDDIVIVVSSETTSPIGGSPSIHKSSRRGSQNSRDGGVSQIKNQLMPGGKNVIDLSICSIGELHTLSKAFDSNVEFLQSSNDQFKTDASPEANKVAPSSEATKLTPKGKLNPTRFDEVRMTCKRLKTAKKIKNTLKVDTINPSFCTSRLTVKDMASSQDYLDTEPVEDMPQLSPILKRRLKTISKEPNSPSQPSCIIA